MQSHFGVAAAVLQVGVVLEATHAGLQPVTHFLVVASQLLPAPQEVAVHSHTGVAGVVLHEGVSEPHTGSQVLPEQPAIASTRTAAQHAHVR